MNNLFKENNQTVEETLETLKTKFGDGQNFDVDKLANAKLESDKFIHRLQTELEELRGELTSKVTMDTLLTEVRKLSEVQNPSVQNSGNPAPEPKPVDNSTIEQLVEEKLRTIEAKRRTSTNEALVVERLEKEWGADANVHLTRKARELGVSLAELQSIAISNPSVFFNAIGLAKETAPAPSTVPPRGSVNGQTPSGKEVRNKKYYEALKLRDKNLYFSKDVQKQMMKDAMEQGEAYYV